MQALPPAAFQGTTPEMRPDVFFAGVTSSTGVLENRSGAALADGSFRLDQTISFDGRPPQTRSWLLRRVDDHRYAGTLTDAAGPVEGEAYGDLFHLRYPMQTPFGGRMEQWLYLQPDGRTVVNEATIRVLGLVVAHLSERITHELP